MIKEITQQKKQELQNIKSTYPITSKILLSLFIIDFIFVLLHFYSLSLPITENFTKNLRLDRDFGYSEIFQYLQFITTAILLAVLFFKERIGVYLIWALFFLFLCVDDAFSFHENLGYKIVKSFNISDSFGLRGQDLGELIIAGALGLLFVVPFLYNLLKGNTKAKLVTWNLILLMGVLVFFGVGFDMIHSLLKAIPGGGIFTVIEDGGELFAVSLILWYVIYLIFESFSEQEKTS